MSQSTFREIHDAKNRFNHNLASRQAHHPPHPRMIPSLQESAVRQNPAAKRCKTYPKESFARSGKSGSLGIA
jgi:hypothetical protein